MHSDSVYRLVDELVKAISEECNASVDVKVLKKCRSLTFGVLLGKRKPSSRSSSSCIGLRTVDDPVDALECHYFELLMTARYRYQVERNKRFEHLLDQMKLDRKKHSGQQLNESDRTLLQFLLLLKNQSPDDSPAVRMQTSFFFNGKMPAIKYGPYPIFKSADFRLDHRLIESCYDEKSNPYLYRTTASSCNVFTAHLANMIAVEAERAGPLPVDCGYFSDNLAAAAHYDGPFRYNLLKNGRKWKKPPAPAYCEAPTDTFNCPEAKQSNQKLIYGMNWENLGERFVPQEKSFLSECQGSLFRLLAVEASTKSPKERLDIKVVGQSNFLRDIKFLLMGISSSVFHFDESNRFLAVPNLTLEDVRISSMQPLIDRALEIGTCFRRLQMMTRKNPYTLEMLLEGFVFRAFCESVANFLCCYRVLVNAYEGPSVLQLLHTLAPATDQLLAMAKLCGIHPQHESDRDFPTGSRLLDHLYRELLEATRPCVSAFLLSTLRRCSLEYFAIFQRWLFGGQLHDPSGELFVYFVDHYRPNTKHFFDKAYLIRRHSVPGFLRGFEEDVLLCGKYAQLLKAFRPLHPLFTLRQPELTVCLSFEAVDQLRVRWLRYANQARQLCGPTVSVRELYEAQERAHEERCRQVEEGFRLIMDKWRQEQTAEEQELERKKKKQFDILLGQLTEARENKLAAKRRELLREVQDEHDRMEVDSRRLLDENYELVQRVEKYTELNRLADKQLERLKLAELSIVPVVTVSSEPNTEADSEAGFQSCRESYASATSPSVYEDAQKSPVFSINSSSSTSTSISSSSARAPEKDLDASGSSVSEDLLEATIVECPIVPQIDSLATETDRINCNLPTVVVAMETSEGERNRQRVLGSTLASYLKEDTANANVPPLVSGGGHGGGMSKLTEAQRNKLKILSQEFEIAPTTTTTATMDVNCNRLEESRRNREKILISDYTTRPEGGTTPQQPAIQELTELQRNRRKIMNQEYNLVLGVDEHDDGQKPVQKGTMYLTLDTDRARNRRRVMDSEYAMGAGLARVEHCTFADTPMSVDSDTMESSVSPSVFPGPGSQQEPQDINANPLIASADGSLKLDVVAAAEAAERFEFGRRFGIPDTATLQQETPASALKEPETVDGFDFAKALTLERTKKASVPADVEDDEIYREFVQALRKQTTNFFRLAIPPEQGDEDAEENDRTTHDPELNSLDPLTITRFLQYSLVIPLRAHMEIVNNEILKMYLYDLDLLSHFESLRNYFLLMDGEFSAHICDSLFGRLETVHSPHELLNYQILHAILDGALYCSNAGSDPNAERLSFIVRQIPDQFDLYDPNAICMLNLSYRVEWPLNLILTPEAIEQYTNVFRYLVKVRRISYALENAFELLKDARKRIGRALLQSPQYARVQLIRHKLSQLVNALKTYLSSMLSASWETFRADLQDATETMEDLYRKHRTYVKRIIFLCLLNKRSIELYDNIEKVFRVVMRFYCHLRSKDWQLQPPGTTQQERYVHPLYGQMLVDELKFDKLVKGTLQIGNKLYDEGYLKEIFEFLHLVNTNGYYEGNVG
ncbi:gamma-tubulin complex component 6 [Anopheles darlingi]|uniref:gamma-tubulin complex component 6 n=1 Tax=Anopheles darlingi TaxID=43151 RepID=UPI002100491D|nr:gamma-tubulin complex component 6 [Anopheles darlingi]XP_049540334.1 gamma-tubulin complex component 6 [Anopheles darlingi]